MKAIDIRSERPFRSSNSASLGVQTYGEHNDFPQRVDRIVNASCTGRSCLKIFADFIFGQGFDAAYLNKLVVNDRGQALVEVLRAIVDDYAKYNGFAVHVNYDGHYRIVEMRHVPFEHLRFEKVDQETRTFTRIAEHDDWAEEFTELRKFRKSDIVFYDLFDPRPEAIDAQVRAAGGWDAWRGQVLYFSGDGNRVYPTPIYEPELTDMRTEEAIANILGRNAANNMLTAGALVDINNRDQSEEEAEATKKTLREFQGDENASNILYLQVQSEDEVPRFISFSGENYDKAFTFTADTVPNNIGRIFNQPPILRAQDVGANFGADLMVNAYNYYNTRTGAERATVSRVLSMLFEHWYIPVEGDFFIRPLAYVAGESVLARFGADVVTKIYDVMLGAGDQEQKRAILTIGYGLSEAEATSLLETSTSNAV